MRERSDIALVANLKLRAVITAVFAIIPAHSGAAGDTHLIDADARHTITECRAFARGELQ